MFDSLMPIVVAGLIPYLFGALWYHPRLFGRQWLSLMRISPEIAERGQKRRRIYSFFALIVGIVLASALSFLLSLREVFMLSEALLFGVILSLAVVAPTSIGDVLWEQKRFALYLIDLGFWTISIVCMALVLALW